MNRSFFKLAFFIISSLFFLSIPAFSGPPVWQNLSPLSGFNLGIPSTDPQAPSYPTTRTNVWISNGPDGGSVNCLVINPRNPLILYAGTETGVYKSVNGGASWRAINNGLENKYILAIAIDTHDSSILYTSSGDLNHNYSKLYKSINGGEDWSVLADFSSSYYDFLIVLDPTNAAVIYIAWGGWIHKSSDGGLSWVNVFKSEYRPSGSITSLILDPTRPETIYVSEVPNYIGTPPSGLHKSTDGGKKWIDILISDVRCLSIDPLAPNTIYAGILKSEGQYSYAGEILKSLDGGTTWTRVFRKAYSIFSDIRIHPLFSNEIYAVCDKAIFRSTNGGVDWQEIAQSSGNKKSIRSLVFDPVTPSTIYASSRDCGVLKSVDRGAHWAEINTNIRNAKIGAIAVDPSDPDTIYAGAFRGCLFVTRDGGGSWQTRGTVPTEWLSILAVDPVTPSTLYAGGLGIFKSTDSGLNWDPILDGLPSYPATSAIVINPNDHMTILAASSSMGIYKSTDGGGSWKKAMNGLPGPGSFLVPDPSSPDVLYTSITEYSLSGLYKTSDGGANWAKISDRTGLALAVDPVHPNNLYLTSSGIFWSSDGGAHWETLYTDERHNTFESLIIHPFRPSIMYALGLDGGVYISMDGGSHWRLSMSGITSTLAGINLAINPKKPEILYLSTAGGGVYRLDFDSAEYPPLLALSRKKMTFGSTSTVGTFTGLQSITVSNAGGGTLTWVAYTMDSWITVDPGSGSNTGTIRVGVNPYGLPLGLRTGSVYVSDPNAINNPQKIDIFLNIYQSGGWTTAPIGSFDSPIGGSMVTSSIAVTGWALDDIEVVGVKIYRDPVVSEPTQANGLVYIGDAFFVEGARPDVETAYSDYPLNYRAGWGYMLLTNCLPGGGNGTFTLYAIARDKEGNQVSLGQKMIVCDNKNALKPFGAIDTPGQGGTASGSAFINFGWALSPQPKSIPIDGSTITVWVDGLPLGHPTYNNFRPDIAALFPGYANTNGAVGFYYLDTTVYLNGVHTIAWSVEDSQGAVDGIGSRYFQILNTGSGSATGGTDVNISGMVGGNKAKVFGAAGGARSIAEIQNLHMDLTSTVHVRRGYDFDRPAEPVYPNREGRINVSISELERVAIYLDPAQAWGTQEELEARGRELRGTKNSHVPSPVPTANPHYSAYLLVGSELRPLPIGATFDAERGVLYWQPGPGFLGDYDFIFVDGGRNSKKAVKIQIGTR